MINAHISNAATGGPHAFNSHAPTPRGHLPRRRGPAHRDSATQRGLLAMSVKIFENILCTIQMVAQYTTKCTKNLNLKKRSEETQTLRAAAIIRRSQKFWPAADPFQGARDGQNVISWRRSLPLLANPVW